jgi:hypothetical protein
MDEYGAGTGTPADDGASGAVTIEAAPAARRARTRVLAGVGAAMLVAAAGGIGFGIGRPVAPSDDLVAGAEDPAPPPATVAGTSPDLVPDLVPDTATADGDAAPQPTVAAPPTEPAESAADAPAGTIGAVTTELASPYGPAYELLDERRLDGGIRVRVLLGPDHGPGFFGEWPGDGWQPAPYCYGNREMRITVDGPDVVDLAFGQWYDDPFLDVSVVAQGDVGWADGRPLRLLAMQVSSGVDEVVVRWADGVTAAAPVSNGLAITLVDGVDAFAAGFEIDLVSAGEVTTFAQSDLDPSSDPAWRAGCVPPPPALPDAGEQPADPDAEREAITARFLLLWDQTVPPEDKPELLDDRTGVDAAVEAVFSGGFAEAAESAEHRVEELVFTSPTTAWFRYGIDTTNGYFGDRYGVAKLTGDGWIFPRALMCQDLSLAGGQCEPPTEAIYPPSWYEINGGLCTYPPTGGEGVCTGYDESEVAAWL